MKFDFIIDELFWTHFLSVYTNILVSAMLFIFAANCKLSKAKWILLILIGAALSIVSAFSLPLGIEIVHVFNYFATILLLLLLTKSFTNHKVGLCFVSVSGALAIELIVSFAIGILGFVLHPLRNLVLMWALSCITQIVFTYLLLHIKRFKNGIGFFIDENRLGIGLVFAGIAFILDSIDFKTKRFDGLYLLFITIGFFIIGIGLYFWIRRSITAHYRERLQARSEEHFQELIKEKEEENAKLTKSNEFLAKVVHRDNHLMASLDSSINAYFESDDKAFKDNLLREIQTLANERGELIEKEQRDSKLLPSTGNILIDGTIGDLYIKAVAHGIDFDLTVSETVDEIIGKYISQTELQTLLCDHIKDAVIAVDAAGKDNGRILVELSVKNGDYTIAVFDNGVDFYPEMLAKLGKERVTTHAENGGSGIGFMTTFETLRKAHASLIITEFENKTPFSKSVSFIFNGENSFIIKSYRAEQLKAAINREDVVII